MYKLGLKLWSINENYIQVALKLYQRHIYDFIELYVVPGTFDIYASMWKQLKVPFVVHAPTSQHGVNLAEKKYKTQNIKFIQEAQLYADKLKADTIIFHGGD